jgi:hypothetical protein
MEKIKDSSSKREHLKDAPDFSEETCKPESKRVIYLKC